MFFILALLSIVIFCIYTDFHDQKLLKTVTNTNRGTRSERKMILRLLKSGVKSTAIFHDLYLHNGNGNYCQIDLVVATKVGIVVFEIKEYSGWIFGSENQLKWTQVLAYGKRKYKFYNPILQNKKHVEDLKKFYLFDNIPFYSVIVFFGNCEFKNFLDLPSRTFLTKSSTVMNTFEEIIQNYKLANYGDKWEIVNLLKEAVRNGENSIITKKHIENIEKLKSRYRFTN